MDLIIPDLCQLYLHKGNVPYGKAGVNQLKHGLQCATLAEAADRPDETIVPCLLI